MGGNWWVLRCLLGASSGSSKDKRQNWEASTLMRRGLGILGKNERERDRDREGVGVDNCGTVFNSLWVLFVPAVLGVLWIGV